RIRSAKRGSSRGAAGAVERFSEDSGAGTKSRSYGFDDESRRESRKQRQHGGAEGQGPGSALGRSGRTAIGVAGAGRAFGGTERRAQFHLSVLRGATSPQSLPSPKPP